jgi:type I restriction enzyme, R subunit
LKPEEEARKKIDALLEAAGWLIQDLKDMNLGAGIGVAVREFPLKGAGFADYLLFVERHAIGVIEAKSEGTTLSGVSEQTEKYLHSLPQNIPHVGDVLPFAYESTGTETYFRDLRDPDCRSRRVFAFHQPETLHEWVHEEITLRQRLRTIQPLIKEGLRDCQIEALDNLEYSLSQFRPRALIQMASGSGKTFTSVTEVYRLIKFGGARRVLFLVDRNTLAKQTFQEFQQYKTPDDGRKFTELYNVQRLTSRNIDTVSRVCITTIQRLYAMLRGEEFAEENEEGSSFELSLKGQRPVDVEYNPEIPLEMFDVIITDECHRSIYHLWRQVLEYFDAFIIGLTATPSKQTLGFFNQNLVMEYGHDRAVADGVNVGYDVYRINTKITQGGGKVEAGFFVDKRDKLTRKVRWEQLADDLDYDPSDLDRSVVAKDQIRTVIRTFGDKLFTEIFPGRKEVPKTLVFAKDDSHAEDIVEIVREEFGKGNDFCKKITYRTTSETPEVLIASFRNSYNPRITVTVDMISTGTDIRPLECLLFMRDIHSSVYFEQMKGRGTRTISDSDLKSVSGDAESKTHFVIVDAVGVCESDKTDSRPLERKRTVPFDKLLGSIAMGIRDPDTLTSLAGRLARFDKELNDVSRKELEKLSNGKKLKQIINELFDAVDPDKQIEKAKELFKTQNPTPAQVKKGAEELAKAACTVFSDKPEFRNRVIEIKQANEQTIDSLSKDELVSAGFDAQSSEKARLTVDSFKNFIEKNKDELTALQIIYSQPYSKRLLTYEAIKELAEAIKKPPYNLTPELVWLAYEQLEKSKVLGAGPQRLLTNIVSLVRFAVGSANVLEPFPDEVDRNFNQWLRNQEGEGKQYTPEQKEWLDMIKQHITTSLSVNLDAFAFSPFNQKGGAIKAYQLFGQQLNNIIEELNTVLVK